jgi:hypothetical protein
MARPPKLFYDERTIDSELRQFLREQQDEDQVFHKWPHIPTEAVRSVILALLDYISIPGLNRKVAAADLTSGLLRLNRFVLQVDNVRPKKASDVDHLKSILQKFGPRSVPRTLENCCRHSGYRMRAESDEVLRALLNAPIRASISKRRDWLNANLPTLLASLKRKHRCHTECPGHTEWPPHDTEYRAFIETPQAGNGLVAIKNAILAYFHGIKEQTVRLYLEGRKLKSASRSRKPRS